MSIARAVQQAAAPPPRRGRGRGRGRRASAAGRRKAEVDGQRNRSEGGGGAADGKRRPPGLARAPAVRAYGVREEERRTDDLFFNQASEWSGPRMLLTSFSFF